MAEAKVQKIAIAVPSYKGPSKECFDNHYEFLHYLGRLQERSWWLSRFGRAEEMPKLDSMRSGDETELRAGDPVFQFGAVTTTGNSMIGQARDIIVERALKWGADYIFFFDDDMIFARDAFLRLWRRQVPFVGALAFTSREPIAPVLYQFGKKWNPAKMATEIDVKVVLDYPRNQLVRVDAIGAGVVLIERSCFEKLPPPWFNGSISAGEDVHFCVKLAMARVPVYCDTSVKTMHVPNEPLRWHDELYYLEQKEKSEAYYKAHGKAAFDHRDSDVQQLAPVV